MALLTRSQIEFAGMVAAGTGLHASVIGAQCLQEESGAAALARERQRNYNWLNIGWYTEGRGSITYDRTWGNNKSAAQATIDFFLGRRFGPGAGIRAIVGKSRGRDPQTQISAICTSGWATDPLYCSRIRDRYAAIMREGIRFPRTGTGVSDLQLGPLSVDLGGGQPGVSAGGSETRVLPYEFSRGSADKRRENSWDAIGRLADEVNWRRFVRNGTVWYVSEEWLQNQPPAFPTLSQESPGVVNLSFDFETRRDPAEASLTVQAERYTILPGDLLWIEGEGPADGKWLVNSTRRSLYSRNVEVSLKRPRPKLEEPAPEVQSVSVGGGIEGGAVGVPGGGIGGVTFDVNVSTGGPETAQRTAEGVANFDGKPVAKWIYPILRYGRAHGWTGRVTSGFRSYADQKRIYDSGVRPCAVPGTSNHEGSKFPRGAVDVSNASQLSAILLHSQYRTTLVWAGAKDPVHFSHPHGGSY